MTGSLTAEIEGIGPVLVERSRRARRVSITIRPPRRIRVAVPRGVAFDKALEFVRRKRSWIQKHLAGIAANEPGREAMANLSAAIDRAEAKRSLTARLGRLAREHGFTYRRVSIRRQKTRWGSCSQDNNISLNVKLVLLPDDLADYVMLHELVHTRVHNHGKGFWAELDKHVGSGKALAARLRKYGLGLP
jgi:hypothetical protein